MAADASEALLATRAAVGKVVEKLAMGKAAAPHLGPRVDAASKRLAGLRAAWPLPPPPGTATPLLPDPVARPPDTAAAATAKLAAAAAARLPLPTAGAGRRAGGAEGGPPAAGALHAALAAARRRGGAPAAAMESTRVPLGFAAVRADLGPALGGAAVLSLRWGGEAAGWLVAHVAVFSSAEAGSASAARPWGRSRYAVSNALAERAREALALARASAAAATPSGELVLLLRWLGALGRRAGAGRRASTPSTAHAGAGAGGLLYAPGSAPGAAGLVPAFVLAPPDPAEVFAPPPDAE